MPVESEHNAPGPPTAPAGGGDIPAWMLCPQAAIPAGQSSSKGGSRFVEKTLGGLAHLVASAFDADAASTKDGLLQGLDPRVKLVSLLGFVVAAVLAHRLATLAAFVALALALAVASHLGLRRFVLRAWTFVPLFTALIALPAITNWVSPGRTVLTFWRAQHLALGPLRLPATLAITAPGLLTAAHLVLRVTAAVSFAVLLTLSTRWNDLLRALRVVRVPQMFVFVLAMTYRYIHLLGRLLAQMLLAHKSRSVGPASAAENRRFLGASAGALFGKSQALSEQVYAAMLARGYAGEVRTLEHWRLRRLDVAWIGGCLASLSLLVFLALIPRGGF